MITKPYPRYKDSGVEWLGRIPTHWGTKRFKFFASVRNGQVDPEDQSFEDMVLLAPNHIESGTGRLLATETAKEQAAISGKYLVQAGEIIYSKIRPALNKAAIATSDCLCSADMYPIRAFCDLEPSYMLLCILGDRFVRHMVDKSMRVAMPKVNRDDLYNCWFAVPPDSEQRAIAEFLDRETGRIDALVKKKEQLLELLQEQRTALISHAVTQGLNPNAPKRDSGIPWLGHIPKHWEIMRLSTVCGFEQGKAHEPFVDDAGEFICVNARFISTEGASVKFCRVNLTPAKHNDILMVMSDLPNGRALAKAYFVNDNRSYAVNQRVCRLTAHKAHPRFLFYQLNRNEFFLQHDDGANQTHLYNGLFTRFPALLPPLSEQATIANYLDGESSKLDALMAKVRTAIERLQEYRTALISAAVTGQIDVRKEAA